MTPSGAPPMPITAWTPVPETAQLIAADRSPSVMSLIRAPAARTSSISASWRGRSRMTTVMSLTLAAERRRRSGRGSRSGELADVDLAGGARPDAQLLEVRVRSVEQAAVLGRREDRDRAGLAVGDEVRALERVDRDVDPPDSAGRRSTCPADLLADVEHRRLVALALADDDPAGELDLVHRPAHRLDGGVVGLVLLAAAHEPRRSDRRRLGDADHLEREQLFHQAPRARRLSGGSGACPVNTIAM